MKVFVMIWKRFGMLFLMAAMIIFFGIMAPKTFLTETTLFNILKQGSVTGICACGVTMMLITGGIDLSVASRLALTQILTAQMLLAGVPIWICVIFAIVFTAFTGALNAVIAETLHTSIFVVTMAAMYIYTGACYLTVGATTIYGLPNLFKRISQTLIFNKIPSIVLIFAACALVANVILAKTTFGRHMYALGGNREAARLSGINVRRTLIGTHALAGAFVGMASIALMSRTGTTGAIVSSSTYSFDSIIAAVLGGVAIGGGLGNIYQTVLGIIVIYIMFNGLTIIHVSDYWQMVVKGVILFLAIGLELLLRRSGATLGSTKKEKETKQKEAA